MKEKLGNNWNNGIMRTQTLFAATGILVIAGAKFDQRRAAGTVAIDYAGPSSLTCTKCGGGWMTNGERHMGTVIAARIALLVMRSTVDYRKETVDEQVILLPDPTVRSAAAAADLLAQRVEDAHPYRLSCQARSVEGHLGAECEVLNDLGAARERQEFARGIVADLMERFGTRSDGPEVLVKWRGEAFTATWQDVYAYFANFAGDARGGSISKPTDAEASAYPGLRARFTAGPLAGGRSTGPGDRSSKT